MGIVLARRARNCSSQILRETHCTGDHRHIQWRTADRFSNTSTGIALEKPLAKEATRVVVVAPADLVASECRSSALALALVGTFEAFPGHRMT